MDAVITSVIQIKFRMMKVADIYRFMNSHRVIWCEEVANWTKWRRKRYTI